MLDLYVLKDRVTDEEYKMLEDFERNGCDSFDENFNNIINVLTRINKEIIGD